MDKRRLPTHHLEAPLQYLLKALQNPTQEPGDGYIALQNIRRILSDKDREPLLQNSCIKSHVDRILCSYLSQLLHQAHSTENLSVVLQNLNLLWNHSSQEYRLQSIYQCRDILPALMHLWSKHRHDTLVVPLLRAWAKVKDPILKDALFQHGIIRQLLSQFTKLSENHIHQNSISHEDVDSLLWLIRDLSFRASPTQKHTMATQLPLWELVVRPSHNIHISLSVKATEALAATLWNLCLEETLVRDLWASDDKVWKGWEQLLMRHKNIILLRHASSGLGTMVATLSQMEFDNGVPHTEWMVPRLLNLTRHEHPDLVRRCVRTLRCLASCGWGRRLLQKHSLSETLQHILTTATYDGDARVQACQTLAALLPHTGAHWSVDTWLHIEHDLLILMENGNEEEKVVLAAAQALSTVLSEWPFDTLRNAPTLQPNLLERLVSILGRHVDQSTYHEAFSRLLWNVMALEDMTCTKWVSTPAVALYNVLLSPVGPDFEESKRFILDIVTKLAEDRNRCKVLADHEDLLTSLVNFCLYTNGELKNDAKRLTLRLVQEM